MLIVARQIFKATSGTLTVGEENPPELIVHDTNLESCHGVVSQDLPTSPDPRPRQTRNTRPNISHLPFLPIQDPIQHPKITISPSHDVSFATSYLPPLTLNPSSKLQHPTVPHLQPYAIPTPSKRSQIKQNPRSSQIPQCHPPHKRRSITIAL